MALANWLLMAQPAPAVAPLASCLLLLPALETGDGTFELINVALNQLDRKKAERDTYSSILCIDDQIVKLPTPYGLPMSSTDANKRVNGRNQELVVAIQRRLWVVAAHAANEAEGPVTIRLISDILWHVGERLEKVYSDQAYNGVFAWALTAWSINFEKALRLESAQGFVPIAKRWVVERSIIWTNIFRRVVKDYERTVSSSASWLYLANIQIILQQI